MHTYAGWVYVAFVIDCFSHRIVSWSAATSKSTDLVMDVVRMATTTRAREGHPVHRGQLIHHSDAGSQYTSIRLTEHLLTEGILPSTRRRLPQRQLVRLRQRNWRVPELRSRRRTCMPERRRS